VIIKVDLGILKVLVEAHGSRLEFIQPDDGKIFFGPFSVHVTRSRECLIMERVKRLVGNEIELGIVDTK
jgi:hypothetical protein